MSQTSKELLEFKQEILSVLLSVKGGLPLDRVVKDYEDLLQKPLPFRQLGFNSEKELLSAVPDVVRLEYHGEELYLYPVCNQNVTHIAHMVKKSRKKKCAASRETYIVPPRFQQSSLLRTPAQCEQNFPKVPPWMKEKMQELLNQYPDGLQIQNVNHAYRTFFGSNLNIQNFDCISVIDFIRVLHNEKVLKLCENSGSSFIFPIKPASESYQSETTANNNNHTEKDVSESESNNLDEIGHINKGVLENLRKILKLFPEGFPMTQLCENYKNVTGHSLSLSELSYNNVQELVNDLEEVFRVQIDDDGEWILLDARLPTEPEEPKRSLGAVEDCNEQEIPDCIQQNIYDLLKHFPDGINLQQFSELYEVNFSSSIGWKELNYKSLKSMLLSLNFNPPIRFVPCGLNDMTLMLSPKGTNLQLASATLKSTEQEITIPEDAVILGQVYRSLKVPYEVNDIFLVQVSTVDTPGRIWLQFLSETKQRNIELDNLMDELDYFYHSSAAKNYRIPETYLTKTLNCAVIYPEDQNWHRGCILDKVGPDSYKVFYYDYGTICVAHKSLLRFLKKSFAVLPAQAFCARLANMQPLSTGTSYSLESSTRLLELVSGKPLMTWITSKTYMNMYSVILCDTSGDDDIYFNDILVKEGLVQICSDQVALRRPFEIRSPGINDTNSYSSNSSPELPSSVMFSNPQVQGTTPFGVSSTFDNSFASQMTSQVCPNQFSSISGGTHPSTNLHAYTQIYHPPKLSDLHQSLQHDNSILDPVILRRLEERVLARRNTIFHPNERANAPQAAVEPIQVSRRRSLEPEVSAPVRLDIETDVNEFCETEGIHYIENSDNQKTSVVYESSREDQNQETSSQTSLSVSTIPNPCANQVRYCKKISFREDQYNAHIINFDRQSWFNSGDVSSFIFGVDIIKRFLRIRKYPDCHIVVSRKDQPDLFQEFENFEITGFTMEDAKTDKVVLYALKDVIEILRFLDQNKETLVEDIEELLNSFDPDDPYWFTNEGSVKTDSYEETLLCRINDLKEERKCLLLGMLAEECSSIEDTRHLLELHQDILDLKAELKSHLGIKTIEEQARDFLERVKMKTEIEEITEYNCPVGTSLESSPPVETNTESSPQVEASTESSTATLEISTECNPFGASSGSNTGTVETSTDCNTVETSTKYNPAEKLTQYNSVEAIIECNYEGSAEYSPSVENCEECSSTFETASSASGPPSEHVQNTIVVASTTSNTVYNSPGFLNQNNVYMSRVQPSAPLQQNSNAMTTFQVSPHFSVSAPTFYHNRFVYQPQNLQCPSQGLNNFRFVRVPYVYK